MHNGLLGRRSRLARLRRKRQQEENRRQNGIGERKLIRDLLGDWSQGPGRYITPSGDAEWMIPKNVNAAMISR